MGVERTLPFPLELTNGVEVARIGDAWLAGAEPAFLEWVPTGRFETTLRVEDFRMNDATYWGRQDGSRTRSKERALARVR